MNGTHQYPLNFYWILSYCVWNASFSYGFNFSTSTRVVLMSSIIVSFFIIRDLNIWLACRCYSLSLNMILRAYQVSYLYTPGKSRVTALASTKTHSCNVILLNASVNLVFLIGYVYNQIECSNTAVNIQIIPICTMFQFM